ncbi:MAG: glycosyltransferase [Spirochaetaceae bacterium]|nr:glycosyltransferase [Myxococcales bacterium]MCB9725982.1 glycosyltransferase [Spirochaetaceae bacterium]
MGVGTEAPAPAPDAVSDGPRRVAYVMSRFPKLTETFVLDEMLELERRGVAVEIFPLWRERADVVHPEARPLVERAHYTRTLDLAILRDNLLCLVRRPRVYLGTLWAIVVSNVRSARYLVAALAIFPKSVHMARRLRALGVEHVHAHFASHPAAAAFVVGRLAGIPWSFTAHGSDLHREQAMLDRKVAEAAFVVAISDYNRRFILDRVDPRHADRVCVIHCGIEPDRFESAMPGELRGGRLELACIGTLHAVKGQGVLLEACAQLERADIAFRCHLVGDGPDRAALERRVHSLGLDEHVVFHGRQPRAVVRGLLARVHVAVAPSVPTADGRREGIPVVLMEAAACGLPLVASRLSGIPELVESEQSGLLVEPGDVDGLAAALARLAREPETRVRLGRAARARVEAGFALAANVERLRARFAEAARSAP